jgi:hypothetical protein
VGTYFEISEDGTEFLETAFDLSLLYEVEFSQYSFYGKKLINEKLEF